MNKEVLKQYYQQYRVIIFPVLTSLASLILITLVISPQLFKLISNNEAYGEIIQKSELLEVKANELETVDGKNLKENLDASLIALPAGKDLAETMGLLQSIVSQSGFGLDSIQFGSGAKDDKNTGFSVRIEVSGTRLLLSTLLSNIESSYRPMKVESVDILSSRVDGINGVINISVFYEPIPSSVGNIDAPVPKLSANEQELIDKLSQMAPVGSTSVQNTPVSITTAGKSDPFE